MGSVIVRAEYKILVSASMSNKRGHFREAKLSALALLDRTLSLHVLDVNEHEKVITGTCTRSLLELVELVVF